MSQSSTHICQLACALVGLNRIASITGTSAVERDCASIYPDAVKAVLEGYHWGFARKQIELTLAADEDQPLMGAYSYAYILPADCVRPIILNNASTKFKRYGDFLFCNLDDSVYLEYTRLVEDPNKFSPAFVTALAHRIAAFLALMVKKDKKMSQEMWDLYYGLLPTLEADDGRSDYQDLEQSNPYIDARAR